MESVEHINEDAKPLKLTVVIQRLVSLADKLPEEHAEDVLSAVNTIKELSGYAEDPLTVEEMKGMNGDPVWTKLLTPPRVKLNGWSLAYRDCVSNRIGWLDYRDYGKTWVAYRHEHADVEEVCVNTSHFLDERPIEGTTMRPKVDWVSAAERLPSLSENTLVFRPKHNGRQKVFQAFLSKGFRGDQDAHWLTSAAYDGDSSLCRRYEAHEITHWTRMPEPPVDGAESPWIPVSEGMEEELKWLGEVLIFVPVSPFSLEEHEAIVTTTFFKDGEWYGRYDLKDVTHWMPMPEPPKEV